MVFLRPRDVLPGILGPTMEDVYLMISVSGGNRTPNNEGCSLLLRHIKAELVNLEEKSSLHSLFPSYLLIMAALLM